jgi:hypothetical protein
MGFLAKGERQLSGTDLALSNDSKGGAALNRGSVALVPFEAAARRQAAASVMIYDTQFM